MLASTRSSVCVKENDGASLAGEAHFCRLGGHRAFGGYLCSAHVSGKSSCYRRGIFFLMRNFNWTEWILFLFIAAVLIYFIVFDARWEWPPPWRMK